MAHSENIISSIKLPNGTTYEVHDAKAIHDVSELGLSAALVFKGTKATISDLPTTGNKVGDVWLVTATNGEYVWTEDSRWEAFGNVYDAASSAHTHNVTVTGTNKSSTVTGTVVVPTITANTSHLYATAGNAPLTPTTTKIFSGDKTIIEGGVATKTKISATVSDVAVGANGTAKAITGFGTHTTAAAITALNTQTINNPTATAGTAASWNASVTNGVLSFDFTPNTPTAVSTSPVSVATSAKTTANAITALGTPTTATALTGVKVTTQPTATLKTSTDGDISVVTSVSTPELAWNASDEIEVLTGVTAGSPTITLMTSSTERANGGSQPVVNSVTIGSANSSIVNGTAAAQAWTQSSGVTGQPK